MKCLIVFAIICAVALAQRQDGLERFIGEEVRAIIRANPSITVADCTAKCDAVFALDVPRDEEVTDRDCARECRVIHYNRPQSNKKLIINLKVIPDPLALKKIEDKQAVSYRMQAFYSQLKGQAAVPRDKISPHQPL